MLKIKYTKKFELLVFLLSALTLSFTPSSRALEIVIDGNGSGSQSEVNLQLETQTQVDQTNVANIQNNVVENVDTGGNTTGGNTEGDVNIQTGEASSTTSINNALNTSTAKVEECCGSNEMTITANGESSDNSINLSLKNSTNIEIEHSANINNSIETTAETGLNKANGSTGGSINIKTGDIKVGNNIVNNPVNSSSIKVSSGLGNTSVLIKENAFGSDNAINTELANDVNVYINHSSNIGNYILWDANTGGNEANGNTDGDIDIATGDIHLETFIKNFANISEVDIDCCEDIVPDSEDGNDDNDDNDDEDPSNGDGSDPDDDNNDNGTQGSILPSAAATEAGGPGIMGLSDTSSEAAKSLFFWLSLILFTFGGKIILEEIIPVTSKDKRHTQ